MNTSEFQTIIGASNVSEPIVLTSGRYDANGGVINAEGGIISVDKFMDKIWGYDSETEQNVVWVYVSYIRRKLAGIGSTVAIEAHRNLGYSLEARK